MAVTKTKSKQKLAVKRSYSLSAEAFLRLSAEAKRRNRKLPNLSGTLNETILKHLK